MWWYAFCLPTQTPKKFVGDSQSLNKWYWQKHYLNWKERESTKEAFDPPNLCKQKAGWENHSATNTCYLSWKNNKPEGRTKGLENIAQEPKIIPRPWVLIKELPPCVWLDFRTARTHGRLPVAHFLKEEGPYQWLHMLCHRTLHMWGADSLSLCHRTSDKEELRWRRLIHTQTWFTR